MRQRQTGFTIIELMIATVVFSVILLMTLIGFIQIGRTFYKGVTIARTESTIRDIADSLSSDIRLSQVAGASSTQTTDTGVSYFCIGQHVYYFKSGIIFDTDSTSINKPDVNSYGLKRDDISGSCAPAAVKALIGAPTTNVKELLGQKMRVGKLSVTCSNVAINRLCEMSIHLAYGDNDLLDDQHSANALCKGATAGTQFCATADINTSILRGGSS